MGNLFDNKAYRNQNLTLTSSKIGEKVLVGLIFLIRLENV